MTRVQDSRSEVVRRKDSFFLKVLFDTNLTVDRISSINNKEGGLSIKIDDICQIELLQRIIN